VELALIELEYSASDHSERKSVTSDLLKRADLTLRLANILTAIAALRVALDAMEVAFDRKVTSRPTSLTSEPSANLIDRGSPSAFAIRARGVANDRA
jgi:hypothetical protein